MARSRANSLASAITDRRTGGVISRRFDPWSGGRMPSGGGQKGAHERLVERIEIGEIFAAVGLGFAEHIVLDKIVNNVAKIGALLEAPGVEHGFRERPILVERILAQALDQFLPRDVRGARQPFGIGLFQLLDGVVQTVTNKSVGLSIETRIFLVDLIDDFGKIEVLHAIGVVA